MILCCQESSHTRPVPQTDTGGQVEHTKAYEITMVKELGKMPRNFGRRGTEYREHLAVGKGSGRRNQ